MSFQIIRLNDVFPEWGTNGIFTDLQNLDVPWKTREINHSLDIEYHGNISGDKIVSPLIRKIMTGDTLDSTEREMLALSIFSIYADNWEKEYDTLSAEYNPIENYSMTEEMTDDEKVLEHGLTRTRTNNLTHAKTGTETDTPNTTETTTPNLASETGSKKYGFNSTSAVPTDEQRSTATGTSATTRTGQETHTYNTSDTDTGTQTDSDSGTDTETRNYTLTRKGNIGVTTSQQMLTAERDLWMWNYFHKVVFPDIDRALTIQIY